MNEVTNDAQKAKDMELEQYVRNYVIFIDTCSLMNQNAEKFWKRITPLLERYNKHIIVPKRVVEEVQKFASSEKHCINKRNGNVEKGKELNRLAIRAENRLGKLLSAGRVKIYGDAHEDFADNVFLTIFTQFMRRYNLLLITQDMNLTHDIRNLAKLRAVQSKNRMVVKKINKSGNLMEYCISRMTATT